MLFLYFLLLLFFVVIIFTIFTTIEIHINDFKFSTERKIHLNNDYEVTIKLYLFEKIRYFKIAITKEKVDKAKGKVDVEKLQQRILENKNQIHIKNLKALQNLQLKIQNLNLRINIGLEDALYTAICVGGISTIIAIILENIIKKDNKNYWKIMPVYDGKNLLNINLDCIIRLKLIHIICTIYKLISKRGGEKNGRTSNRRDYEFIHG